MIHIVSDKSLQRIRLLDRKYRRDSALISRNRP